jgi:hypothetical protein
MAHIESASYYEAFHHQAPQEPIRPAPSQQRSSERKRIFTVDDIKFVKNGIDICRYRPPDKGTDYEDKCFQKIVNDRNDRLILGPHLIDLVFASAFPGRHRPDAIEIDVVKLDEWVVKRLFEFKSGIDRKTTRKLNGFSDLVGDFRSDESYLPRQLRIALPSEISVPEKLATPPDSEIDVVFVTPTGVKSVGVETEFVLYSQNVSAA